MSCSVFDSTCVLNSPKKPALVFCPLTPTRTLQAGSGVAVRERQCQASKPAASLLLLSREECSGHLRSPVAGAGDSWGQLAGKAAAPGPFVAPPKCAPLHRRPGWPDGPVSPAVQVAGRTVSAEVGGGDTTPRVTPPQLGKLPLFSALWSALGAAVPAGVPLHRSRDPPLAVILLLSVRSAEADIR